MITFRIRGTVKVAETGVGLSGLFVKAYDKDILFDDLLGSTYTKEGGHFEIVSEAEDFRDLFEVKPDIYLKVFSPDAQTLLYTTEQAVRWQASRLEEFDVRIPRDRLGGIVPQGTVRLLDDNGEERSSFDVGESLTVQIEGVQAETVQDIILFDENGQELLTSSLLSNRDGTIESATIWPQFGLHDLHSAERFSLERAQERWRGRALRLEVHAAGKKVLEQVVRVADAFTRPLLLSTDTEGVVLNGFEAGERDAIVSAYNLPFRGAARVYMVPRQHRWRSGDAFAPVALASGRTAVADAQVDERGRIRRRVAGATELQPGAYDFIIRQIRYGYEDDEEFQLRASDLVTRTFTGLVVRGDFMGRKTVRGGCSNTMPISGRSVLGRPYFVYGDTFQLGENIYGALDPLALDPNLVGKMVALYVIQHKTPAQWTADNTLNHLAVLGGNPAVQKFLTQPGCINFNERLLWPNANQTGEYDIVVDFGNNIANPAAFATDAQYNMPTDICDGYFVPGFRVVADPTTDTQFANAGTFTYNDGPVTVNDDFGQVTLDRQAVVYFPADAPGATMPGQISAVQASYPMLIVVHGNSSSTSSYLGYNYLLEHWAKNGFVAASVHCSPGMAATGRARVLFEHIGLLKSKFGAKAQNHIGIMGHSRGGEAVVAALRLNHNEALGHNFAAVICLAPSDWILHETMQAAWAVPLQMIYGSMDGDITGGPPLPMATGFAIFDRASGTVKSMVFVYGAIHDRFNTVWGDGDLGFGHLGGSDLSKIITADAHHKIALGYMTAFFRRHLRGEAQWEGIFTGGWRPAAVEAADGGTVKTYHQYAGTTRREMDNFEGVHTPTSWQTSTIGGAVSDDASLPVQPVEDNLWTIDTSSPHQTGGLLCRWDNLTDRLRFDLPAGQRDVSGFDVLSFRVTQKNGSSSNPAGMGKDLYVTLKSGNGKSRSIRAAAFGEIPYPDQRFYSQFTKSAMRTVRIPLSSYKIAVINTDPVDLTDVVSVEFDFGLNSAGEIEVDSVEFSN